MGKQLKGLLYAKGQCFNNNSGDDFCIKGNEKDRYLIRLMESIIKNPFKPSLNTT